MAISKNKKTEIVDQLAEILVDSKMVVAAQYAGLSVSSMQTLRRSAREQGVVIKVAKNRLVKLAMSKDSKLAEANVDLLKGQLLIASSSEDEVAPAQVLATFAKTNPSLELVGGFDASGAVFDKNKVKQLAELPSKDALRGQVVGTIAAPLSGFVNVLSGNVRGFVNVLNARKEAIS